MKKLLISCLLIVTLLGCKKQQEIQLPDQPQILGLASPIHLNLTTTEVWLQDYFLDINLIDSVSALPGLQTKLSQSKEKLILTSGSGLDNLAELKIWAQGTPYSVLLKKSQKQEIEFLFDPRGKKHQSVQMKGEMNAWNPNSANFKLENGIWKYKMLINPGRYQYIFVVDGKEMLDPANAVKIDNNIGGFNSLLEIKDNSGMAPKLHTIRMSGNSMELGGKADKYFVFWENYRLNSAYLKKTKQGLQITLPRAAKKLQRSYIRVWATNTSGVSNDILIPLNNGKILDNANQLTRFDKRAQVLYALMVDRFEDGKQENNHPVDDPEILPKANYMGGDITGITQKIKDGYFTRLGVTTIWLSPISQNPLGAYGLTKIPYTRYSGYHGYWPVSSSEIDFRFGTAAEVKELLKEAHQKNMNVILDYVANHVHQEHPLYKQHPDWTTSLYLPDGSLNTQRWDDYRLTTWFDTFMPTLDLSRPEIVEPMTDSALFWLKEYDFDGFRHDATKHIPEIFWRTLTRKIKQQIIASYHKPIYQIGETYGSRELISSYVNSGQLDAQFDFNLYDDAVAVFARPEESFNRLRNSLQESFTYYGHHSLMGNISGNHDRTRFISLASGDVKFDEDAKLAGWTRKIEVSDTNAYHKLVQLNAFNLTISGVPVFYYGDEYGVAGAGDPDNRRMMQFDGLKKHEEKVREKVTKLTQLRRSQLSLIYGDFKELYQSDKTYSYLRSYFGECVVVAFNKDTKARIIRVELPDRFKKNKLQPQFGSTVSQNGVIMEITVPANGVEVLTGK